VKYFVTGATGFIGGRVMRQLREAGHEVVALVRNPEKARPLLDLGVSIARGDITDKQTLRDPMSGVDGVFHLAAWYKVGAKDRRNAERINVDGTRNVLEVMRDLDIPKGVYTSTLAVFGDTRGQVVDESYLFAGTHISEYDRTKWVAHYDVALPMMAEGLPLVIVQPGLVYGPGDTSAVGRAFEQYLKGKLPMLPSAPAYCWGHVDDTARAHLLAMEQGRSGESYITCGPVHKLVDAFQIAERITGIKAPAIHPGPGVLKVLSGIMGAVGTVVPLPEDYAAETLRVMAGVTYLGNAGKAEREWGWKARPLEEGLRDTLGYLMDKLGITVRAA